PGARPGAVRRGAARPAGHQGRPGRRRPARPAAGRRGTGPAAREPSGRRRRPRRPPVRHAVRGRAPGPARRLHTLTFSRSVFVQPVEESMSRAPIWRAVVAFVILAASAVLAYTLPPRLGLDLRGGTQLVFEARDAPNVKADSEATDRALDVLRRRADALGVVDPTLVRSGERRIIVELPGVLDPRQAAEVIGRTAQLTFHPVEGIADENDKDALADESGQKLKLGKAAITGEAVTDAAARTNPQMGPGWFVTIDFKESGPWKKLTGEAACNPVGDPKRRIAIVLDNEIISSPQVDESVGCNVGITGGSTQIT